MNKLFSCQGCKNNCTIEITKDDEHIKYNGYKCSKGLSYAKLNSAEESKIVTARAILTNGKMSKIPVRTTRAIPSYLIADVIKLIENTKVEAPVEKGTIVIKNVLNTGADVVAQRRVV
jgi:CxxC motif-containing protein